MNVALAMEGVSNSVLIQLVAIIVHVIAVTHLMLTIICVTVS